MRTAIKLFALTLLMLLSTTFTPYGQSNAVTLAGNVTASTTGTASSAWEGQIGAENFSLAQSSTVNQLGFIFWYDQTPSPFVVATSAIDSVDWYLYSDSNPASNVFGTPLASLASGTAASLTITNLGAAPQAPTLYDFLQVRFSIPDTVLSAGDYWVGFKINRNIGASQVYWAEAASGDNLSAILGLSGWTTPYQPGVMTNAVFEVNGDINAVPLPAALPLFATGLGAMGLLGWRRKRKAQAAV